MKSVMLVHQSHRCSLLYVGKIIISNLLHISYILFTMYQKLAILFSDIYYSYCII